MTLLLVLACGLSPSEPSSPGPGPAVVATTPQIPSSLFDGKGQLVAYKGRFAGNPRLDEAQVALIAPEELVLVRNEVFARYGRVFKTDAIREHFEAQDWYAPNPDYSDTLLMRKEPCYKIDQTIAAITAFLPDSNLSQRRRVKKVKQGYKKAMPPFSRPPSPDELCAGLASVQKAQRHHTAAIMMVMGQACSLGQEKGTRYCPETARF